MADTEARVLTEDVEQLGTVDAWLAERREQVAGIAGKYQPREITSRDEYRQSKRERTAARKAIKAVEDERRAKLGAIKDAVRGIEAEVRDLLEPLRGIDDGYREAIEAYERARHQAVLAEADAHYRELAPDLADMVPLSRLEEAYGVEDKWSSASMTGPRLCQLVDGYVDAIAADERTIEQLELPEGETRALKADFYSTLDLSAALRRANERKAKREEVERLEAERAERRRQADAMAAGAASVPAPAPAPAPAPRRDAGDAGTETPTLDTMSVMSADKYVKAQAETSGASPAAQTEPERPEADGEWAFCGRCSKHQAQELVDLCIRSGISQVKAFPTHGARYVLRRAQ